MVMTVAEYLKTAPQRDTEAEKAREEAEAREDEYYDALGTLVEQHPIGRFVCVRGHALDESEEA